MAAVIGDFVSDISRFHNMVNSPSSSSLNHQLHQQQQQQQHQHVSHASPRPSPDRPRPPTTSSSTSATLPPQQQRSPVEKVASPASSAATTQFHVSPNPDSAYTAANFPSPPPSSSPSALQRSSADDANGASMATQTRDFVSSTHNNASSTHVVNPAPATAPSAAAAATPQHHQQQQQQQQPSPPSDNLARSSNTSQAGRHGLRNPAGRATPQNVVHVRDLAHVQSLVQEGALGGTAAGAAGQTKYEISAMPIGDVIEMVAALLTKITGTNDLQHDAMQRNAAHQQQANQTHESSTHMSPLSHSVLAFHGKNVPAITILSYLARIHKYCPTTYEVFLSLLVYFDRMTERVNELVVKSEQARRRAASSNSRQRPSQSQSQPQSQVHSRSGSRQQDTNMPDSAAAAEENSDESDSDLADDDDDDDTMVDSPTVPVRTDGEGGRIITVPDDRPSVHGPATFFVVDSFNIHRLIIAGVTCASKFFSDVFYTNSRYAKVRYILRFTFHQSLTDIHP